MLQFRPHHFLCTLGFEGKGYSDDFVRGFQTIADQLRTQGPQGDQVEIQVTSATDSICAPCPNRRGELCETQDKIAALDQAHASVLGLKPGQILNWGEAKRRIASRMTTQAFESSCAPCAWKKLGVCETALKKLKRESTE
jgi:hypothetical protein